MMDTQDVHAGGRMLRAALKYASEAGWAVFPLHNPVSGGCSCGRPDCQSPGKHPRTPNGFKDATSDPEQIEAWWREYPDANVGIPTGAVTSTVVLDIDGPGAEDALQELGASVPTLTSVTAKGRHILFKHPGRPVRNRGRLRKELDVRADGGYIVVPPSIHASGHRYHWDDEHGLGWGLALAPLPARVLEALTQNGTSDRPVPQPSDAMIPDGDRNNALTRLAGAMRRQGATPAEIESALNNANQLRCVPPLAETEVKQIAASIGHYPVDVKPEDGEDVDAIVSRVFGSLPQSPGSQALEQALSDFAEAAANLTPVQQRIARLSAIKALKDVAIVTPAGLVDSALAMVTSAEGAHNTNAGQPVAFAELEPWSDPVDGAELLDVLQAFVCRFLILPEGAADVLATFALETHAADVFRTAPYIALESPTPECGKTRALEVLALLSARPWFTLMPSTAVLFRVLEEFHPTMLLDECQAVHGRGEAAENVRDLLLAGYKRGAKVPRCVGDQHEVRFFDVFGPKVFALIGELPGALASRCIRIGMQRRRSEESVDSFLPGVEEEALVLAQKARRWAVDHRETLRQTTPPFPGFLRDRLAEIWQPLLTVGLVAGGRWDARLMESARLLSGRRDDDDVRTLLLADIHAVFADSEKGPRERISSADLVNGLTAIEGQPWADWKGRELTANALARLLKQLKIAPKKLKISGDSVHGYEVKAFTEAWERYTPASQPPQPEPSSNYGAERGFATGTATPSGSGCKSAETLGKTGKVPVGAVAEQAMPGDGPVPDERVKELAREYAIGHPDCSRDDVIRHLGFGVALTVANATIDELAGSEDRFARLQRPA